MRKKVMMIPSVAAGIIVGIFLSGGLVSAASETLENSIVSPIPRPFDEMPQLSTSDINTVIPDERDGLRVSAATQNAIVSKGEAVIIAFDLTNSGTTSVSSTTLEIAVQIFPKNHDGPGVSFVHFLSYPTAKPFLVSPDETVHAEIPWSQFVIPNGKRESMPAESGEYIIRITIQPWNVATETQVVVSDK